MFPLTFGRMVRYPEGYLIWGSPNVCTEIVLKLGNTNFLKKEHKFFLKHLDHIKFQSKIRPLVDFYKFLYFIDFLHIFVLLCSTLYGSGGYVRAR